MPEYRRDAGWRRSVRDTWSTAAAAWERWEPVQMHALGGMDVPLIRPLVLRPGHRVLDAGCGIGDPSLTIAQWVAPRGSVIGLDVAASMLEVARRRARARGIRNVRFVRGDIVTF